jgi:hypothetical protein
MSLAGETDVIHGETDVLVPRVQLEYGLPRYVFFGFAVFLVLLALADALYVMVLFQRGFIENLFPVRFRLTPFLIPTLRLRPSLTLALRPTRILRLIHDDAHTRRHPEVPT